MRLLEYQAKRLLKGRGVRVPRSRLVRTPEEAAGIGEAVLKAQVPVGGRGKAGGVRRVSDDVPAAVEEMLGMDIGGYTTDALLAEEAVDASRERYLSIMLDRSAKGAVIIASGEGGVDVEETSGVLRVPIDPLIGLNDYQVRKVAKELDVDRKGMGDLLYSLWDLFIEYDCELVEVNPLGTLPEGLMAMDAKMTINEDSLFRHVELAEGREDLSPLEERTKELGISLVEMEGDIAVIANGAGLTMSTLDRIALLGGSGRIFLDLGGTDDPGQVEKAVRTAHEVRPKVVLVNIFGGITKCDTVARGILDARRSGDAPMVTRILGVNDGEARRMLREGGIVAFRSMDEACRKAVEVAHDR